MDMGVNSEIYVKTGICIATYTLQLRLMHYNLNTEKPSYIHILLTIVSFSHYHQDHSIQSLLFTDVTITQKIRQNGPFSNKTLASNH